MDKEQELLEIARRTGIAAERVIQWNFIEGPLYVSKNPGRPKGKVLRPAGCISIGDARAKYNLTAEQIRSWREEGLPTETCGTLVAIRETVLIAWMKRHGIPLPGKSRIPLFKSRPKR